MRNFIVSMMLVLMPITSMAYTIPGRVAISSDGNKHDCDDIFASAVSIALLAKTGNAGKLVWYGYADHHWATSSGCKGGNREYEMRQSTVETARKYGGFDLTKFYNAKSNRDVAVQRLTDEINKSSSTNRLYIVAAGPMDIVGRALARSASTRRQYVTLISHSTWNEVHSDRPDSNEYPKHSGWTWNEMKNMSSPPRFVDLPDQNGNLNTSHSTYYSWRDSSDSKLRWLWNRNMVAGKSWPDCSDAGMVFWMVGENMGSDRIVTPSELKSIVGG